ncbi:MAG TPA: helix-turn-helix transcriptional regulator [Candidatus Nitrosocosmicus sp.]|nr:helix-turn-helix transcriptional regulator [Candidatus Nitrosocosmicus sp.]
MKGNFVYKRLGDKISKHRRSSDLSQEEVSLRCHMDRTYLGRIEQGKVNPSLRVMIKISRALKIKLSVLLDGIG